MLSRAWLFNTTISYINCPFELCIPICTYVDKVNNNELNSQNTKTVLDISWKYLQLQYCSSNGLAPNRRQNIYLIQCWRKCFVADDSTGPESTYVIAVSFLFIFSHDDVIKWKHFPRYWPFVRGIHRSPVNSPHKGQWHGAYMFSLICAWITGWVNNRDTGDLRCHHAHYDVTVMWCYLFVFIFCFWQVWKA